MQIAFFREIYDGPKELLRIMEADIQQLKDYQRKILCENGHLHSKPLCVKTVISEDQLNQILDDFRKEYPDDNISFIKK